MTEPALTPLQRRWMRAGFLVLVLLVAAVLAATYGPGLITRLRGHAYPCAACSGGADMNPTKLRPIDPFLVTYRQEAAFPLTMTRLLCLAVGPQDRIYIAGKEGIAILDSQGKRLAMLDVPDVTCLAIGPDGLIYAGVRDHVEVLTDQGRLKAAWPTLGERAILTSIALGKDVAFLADAGNRLVWRVGPDGAVLGRIGAKDADKHIEGFSIPSPYFDVAIAPDGLLRVADTGRHRIEAYTFDGDLEFSWGTPGSDVSNFSGCCNPANFAIFPDGRFLTAEKGIPTVKILTVDAPGPEQGKLDAVVAGPAEFAQASGQYPTAQEQVLDVAINSAERVLVLDPAAAALRVFVLKEDAATEPATRPTAQSGTQRIQETQRD